MRLIDADIFLTDLKNECCDVCDTDERYPAYSEFGYSIQLVERVTERQKIIEAGAVTHARWLGRRGELTCSNCGSEGPEDGGYWASPYCPSCGAKMDLESEGTDE